MTRLEVLGRFPDSTITDADLTPAIHAKTVARMLEKARANLANGKIVIVPSAFVKGEMREQFENLAQNYQVPFYGFWLDAPVKLHQERMAERSHRRAQGVHDITTVSAVSSTQIDPSIITGQITWPKIDATCSQADVFASVLAAVPSAIDRNFLKAIPRTSALMC
jgi:predicted kinase